MSGRIKFLIVLLSVFAILLSVRVFIIKNDEKVIKASAGRGQYKISNIGEYASIYDCNGQRLNNLSYEYKAVIDPNSENALKIISYIDDIDTYTNGMKGNLPFLCNVSQEYIDNTIVFKNAVRTDSDQLARHIVGYTSDNTGVCGIEYGFDSFLRENYTKNEATFSINAVGSVLDGLYSDCSFAEPLDSGVVTAIDSDIQMICENALKYSGIDMGTVIVMDVKTGEIKACVSYPQFDPDDLEASINDERSPFINRVFSTYSVGSIFKLVTSAAALELGISPDFTYTCDGSIDVNGQIFNCHKWGGHGEINMYEAIELSCNPYFIALSEYIDTDCFLDTARKFGFGEQTELCNGITSVSGYLPTSRELSVRAELGNFSFGQGKLTATPLQICRMTAAIANNGMCPYPKLILGIKNADGTFDKTEYPINQRVISYLTAKKLQQFMTDTVNADNSYSKSYIVSSAGKTSTAQTGRFNENGTEQLNCWFTGYFPTDNPQYAVTVMIENGYSGNATAAPIYKQIAESITIGHL